MKSNPERPAGCAVVLKSARVLDQVTGRALAGVMVSAALVWTFGCASGPPVIGPGLDLPLPSPLKGPGAPHLERRGEQQVERAWQLLLAGRPAEARQAAEESGESTAARLLQLQSDLVADQTGVIPLLKDLLRDSPGYAAGWMTLSVAAEQEADEAEALAAARKGADLWSRGSWSDRAEMLHDGWVIDRISRATQLVTEAAFVEALELVERALGLEPGNREGLLIKARALIGLERPSEAEKVLASLGADPEAVFLAATIAEQREDWLTAMDLYSALPEGYPQRNDRLSETQLKWRLSHQPRHVKEALHSTEITRSELAILMTALAPELDGLQGEPVPVLSDIVDAAGRREILTVVRVGLLDVDRLEHRFHPDRIVSEAEVRAALERLATLLQRRTPEWCEQLESSSECDMIAAPISGAEVATVILNRSEEVGP